jgi:hypothetical protein
MKRFLRWFPFILGALVVILALLFVSFVEPDETVPDGTVEQRPGAAQQPPR